MTDDSADESVDFGGNVAKQLNNNFNYDRVPSMPTTTFDRTPGSSKKHISAMKMLAGDNRKPINVAIDSEDEGLGLTT